MYIVHSVIVCSCGWLSWIRCPLFFVVCIISNLTFIFCVASFLLLLPVFFVMESMSGINIMSDKCYRLGSHRYHRRQVDLTGITGDKSIPFPLPVARDECSVISAISRRVFAPVICSRCTLNSKPAVHRLKSPALCRFDTPFLIMRGTDRLVYH